jgi:hypothetical protein
MAQKRTVARARAKAALTLPYIQHRVPQLARRKAAVLKKHAPERRCDDWCALNAWQSWRSQHLTPSFNWSIGFQPPAGKRLVIELVSAQIIVPVGESARLRMYTSLPSGPSNIDLYLMPQGVHSGVRAIWVATHSLRVYTDGYLQFNVNRDNASTEGDALVCVSGYLLNP